MLKLSKLLTKIDNFYKLSYNLSIEKLEMIVNNTKAAIEAEIGAAISNLNRMVQNPQYSASETFQTLDEGLSHLSQMNKQLEPHYGKKTVTDMLQYIGSLEFYTNASNAGTGYDPATHVGGVTSMSAYLDRIKGHLQRLLKIYSNYSTDIV